MTGEQNQGQAPEAVGGLETMLDVEKVAAALGVECETVRKMARGRLIKHYRVGIPPAKGVDRRPIRFMPVDVTDFLEKACVLTPEEPG